MVCTCFPEDELKSFEKTEPARSLPLRRCVSTLTGSNVSSAYSAHNLSISEKGCSFQWTLRKRFITKLELYMWSNKITKIMQKLSYTTLRVFCITGKELTTIVMYLERNFVTVLIMMMARALKNNFNRVKYSRLWQLYLNEQRYSQHSVHRQAAPK